MQKTFFFYSRQNKTHFPKNGFALSENFWNSEMVF